MDVISSLHAIPAPMDPWMCILGAVDDSVYPPPVRAMITRLLYVARKQIARLWMSSRVPTVKQWIDQVNSLLIREKLTFQHRGAGRKFYSVWQAWLDSPGLAPAQLVLDRLLQV